MDMMCLMHGGKPYGHLKVGSKVIDDKTLATMVGCSIEQVQKMLFELEKSGVFSRKKDGTIYSRRMVKDEDIRCKRVKAGSQGGNPKLTNKYNRPGCVYFIKKGGLIKIGISSRPTQRLYRLRQKYPGEELKVIYEIAVGDMGVSESFLHLHFSDYQSKGEWFSIPNPIKENILDSERLLLNHLKVKVKDTPNQMVADEDEDSSISIKKGNKGVLKKRFESFYIEYPKKQAKQKALQVFLKIAPSEELFTAMMDGLRRQSRSIQWGKDGGQFIPLPTTWLNGARWEDELEHTQEGPKWT